MSVRLTYLVFLLVALTGLFGQSVMGRAKQHRATAYYVDSQHGNDKHSGTSPKKAWKTVMRANQQVYVPGDSLLFKKGLAYVGQLKPQMASLGSARFVVASYGQGAKPTIDGRGVLPAAVWMFNLQNFEVADLRIVNQAAQRQAKMAGIKVEINNYGVAKDIALRNLDVEDVNGLLEKNKGGGCGILIENGGRQTVSTYHGLLIEGCTIRRCERNAIIFGAYWSRREWNPNLGVVIRKNLIEEVPGDGIVPIGCDGALIEHNVMRLCTRLLPLGEAAAGIWPWSCDNTVIQYNEVSDHKAPWDGQGFDSDWNCRNTLIQYNYSHDNEGGFVLVCDDGGVNGNYSVGNTGTVIRYNVSLNDGMRKHKTHAGVFSPVVHFAGPARDTKFYNNLIVHTGQLADTLDNRFIHFSSWGGMPGATWFTNNVFVSHTPTEIDLADCAGIEFANNLFSGVFKHLPTHNGNLHANLTGNQWLPSAPAPIGFEGLAKYKVGPGFEGVGKGLVIDGTANADFFGNPINGGNCHIGIDQTQF